MTATALNFIDLLKTVDFSPQCVQLMRHRPTESRVAAALPGLRVTQPDLFNIYQSWQAPRLFNSSGIKVIASFIGDGPGRALFAGLWSFDGKRTADDVEWREENSRLVALGMNDWSERPRGDRVRYQLAEIQPLAAMVGRLLVQWQTQGRRWSHRADAHALPVIAIHEESAFDPLPEDWQDIEIGWAQLAALSPRRRAKLQEWRGIYLIFDESDARSYVGSASGEGNILGRWLDYASRNDGGNKLLRGRDPTRFRFSILQRVSPDMPRDEVEGIEASWKRRLHTHSPFGLNAN